MFHDIYIGQSHWRLDTSWDPAWSPEGLRFTRPNQDSPLTYSKTFQMIPSVSLPHVGGAPDEVTEIRRIYLQEGKEAREHLIADTGEVYAVYAEMEPDSPLVFLDAGRPELFAGNSFLFNYIAPERNLLKDGQILLHSCFIIHRGEAILFTAPSGTGKSTQGDHWANLFGDTVVNGDRALLGCKDGIWKAYGSPWSGTSGICQNLQAPIKAIVYLHQAPENHAEPIGGLKAFRLLFEQISMNKWNPAFTEKACELLEDLLGKVPVYEYWLTKEEESAKVLRDMLERI